MDKVRTIRLYGLLGAKFGRVHRFAVDSAAEAVHAMGVMIPGFEAYLTKAKDRGEGYAVFYGKQNLTEELLSMPSGDRDIRIAPIMFGAKKAGMGSIIAGAVLVVIGAFLSVTGIFAWAGVPLMKLGAAMIVGGVVQMLMPVPKGNAAGDRPENTPSEMFNGPINTQAQGRCVPVLYGRVIVGSAVISAGIETKDQAIVRSDRGFFGSGGGGGDFGGNKWQQLTQLVRQ